MTPAERQHRQNIRNYLMVATVEELKAERIIHYGAGDIFGVRVIDEMLADCEAHGVDDHGKTPAFP